ncbi:hypothetical protein NXS08_07115 [Gleimia sp. 6138-11-ORH1]|uniref:hypothetical protein n=1 Tax=Gleimia sp. 6138-11-ORH1 TaxID=2973937 RepID=UPI0021672B83|nr:hypothetical protein [Gleimia sp. 6138-11-ORH1]MCS4485234.1 hypothetical protein [Gleimia sp. 6138-11-ORH1]
MHPTLKIYSLFSRVAFLGAFFLALFISGLLFFIDGWPAVKALPFIAFILWLFYLLWWSPLLVVTTKNLVAFNVWRTIQIPWSTFQGAKLHLGTILETTAGPFRLSTAQPKNRMSELRHPGLDPVPHIDFSASEVSVHLHAQQLVEVLTQWRLLHDEHEKLAKIVPGYAEKAQIRVSSEAILPDGSDFVTDSDQVKVTIRWSHVGITLGLICLMFYSWLY